MSDTCGPTCGTPFASYDRESRSWRTSEATSLWALTLSSLTLPNWGCLHDGELSELPTPELPTDVRDCSSSSLPTPQAADGTKMSSNPETSARRRMKGNQASLTDIVQTDLLPTPTAVDSNNVALSPSRFRSGRQDTVPHAVAHLLATPQSRDWKDAGFPKGVDRDTPYQSLPRDLALHLLPTPRAQNGEERNMQTWARPLDQPQNLENAVARIGAATPPPSTAGNPSSTDPHQPPPSPAPTDDHDYLPYSWSG